MERSALQSPDATSTLDSSVCYRALQTRDARFDGRFFTGVVSTGIYCRPVCPAPTPKADNCRFFHCAAAAQEAGFRPCLRCRPETSPGSSPWLGTSSTVSRALRLISEGALDCGNVEELAERVGVGERHLRRLFLHHLGTPPRSVAQTRRLLFAKRLIDETNLTMADVALSSGFASVRRFNDAIRETYKRTPRELRRASAASRDGSRSEIVLRLAYRPPFHWQALHHFLSQRLTPGIDALGADSYRRTVCIDAEHGLIEVRRVQERNHLEARIRIGNATKLIDVVSRLRRQFDLDADPQEIAAQLLADQRLAPLVRAHPGLRIPGAWDPFEIAVRAVLGQQITVRAATTLMTRLVQTYGEPLEADNEAMPELTRVFPRPERLAQARLTGIGLPATRAAAISSIAAAVRDGDLRFDAARSDFVETLRRIRGIGEWTAEYVALRGLGEPDAFPAADLGLRRALGPAGDLATSTQVMRMAEAWRPWRAYAALYIWTEGISDATDRE
ncbi:MAG: DNA-3-methyladenine glycosylase 2 family protein [Candidatus Latescibacterota bacterium]|nr:MAG: DNA-3-methyladenine glycosylase 2 family protein [Candidatus Latescibacterota bacterium]